MFVSAVLKIKVRALHMPSVMPSVIDTHASELSLSPVLKPEASGSGGKGWGNENEMF